jgi:hypothetical protein
MIRAGFITFNAIVFGQLDEYVSESEVPGPLGTQGLDFNRESFARTVKSPHVAALLTEALNAQCIHEFAVLQHQIQHGKDDGKGLVLWDRAMSERLAKFAEGVDVNTFSSVVEVTRRYLQPDFTPPSPLLQPSRDQMMGPEQLSITDLRTQLIAITSNSVRVPAGYRTHQQFVRTVRDAGVCQPCVCWQ